MDQQALERRGNFRLDPEIELAGNSYEKDFGSPTGKGML